VMSNNANLRLESMGIFFRSVIKWTEFLTLNVCGRGINVSSFLTSSSSILYAKAFVQLTIGPIGYPSFCTFIRPLMVGGVGFRLIYLH
jgi:hypothetical protein